MIKHLQRTECLLFMDTDMLITRTAFDKQSMSQLITEVWQLCHSLSKLLWEWPRLWVLARSTVTDGPHGQATAPGSASESWPVPQQFSAVTEDGCVLVLSTSLHPLSLCCSCLAQTLSMWFLVLALLCPAPSVKLTLQRGLCTLPLPSRP